MAKKKSSKKKSRKVPSMIINEEHFNDSSWEITDDWMNRYKDYQELDKIFLDDEGKIWYADEKPFKNKIIDAIGAWEIIEKTICISLDSFSSKFKFCIKEGRLEATGQLNFPFNIPSSFTAKMVGQSYLSSKSKIHASKNDPRCFKWEIIYSAYFLTHAIIDTYEIDTNEFSIFIDKNCVGNGHWHLGDDIHEISLSFKLGILKGAPITSRIVSYSIQVGKHYWSFDSILCGTQIQVKTFKQGLSGYYDNFISSGYKRISTQNGKIFTGLFKEPFYFFIDIETNGLPKSYPDPKTYPEEYPDIIQIATLCCDSDGKKIWCADKYIIPDDWEIKEDVKELLKIDDDKLRYMTYYGTLINNLQGDGGMSKYDINELISEDLQELFGILGSEYEFGFIVGHNIEFDLNCLKALYYRSLEKEGYEEFASQFEGKFMQYLPKLKKICTMKSTTEFCGIETRHGHKYPKLEELYNKLFDEDIDRQHDAKDDVFITAKCFWRLKDFGLMDTNGENCEDEFHSENENFETVKIIKVTMAGEKECYVHYKKYRNGNFISDGIAFCDDVDEVEIDEENCLTRNSWLSQDGLNLLNL